MIPLIIHPLASIVKRLIACPSKAPPSRPLSSLLSITGYASLLVFLPIHFFTHRVNPSDISAPIFAVGPAELDYDFVKLGLQTWPVRSWLFYAGLVGCVVLHAGDGLNIIRNIWFKDVLGWLKGDRGKRRFTAVGGIILPVLSGVYMLSREPLTTFAPLASRFKAAFTRSFVYQF